MVQPLPGFLNLSLNLCSLCQVLGDVYTEVLEAAHPLHRGPTDHKRGDPCGEGEQLHLTSDRNQGAEHTINTQNNTIRESRNR